jgi:acetyl-CoA C-acetyltransferase
VPLDESRIPVVIGTGQSIERADTVSALELAERAAEQCLDSAPAIRARVQLVSVVNILSKAPDSPATLLAGRLGLAPARTEVTTVGGNSPQWLISRAAEAIAAGELSAALVVGAEAQHSAKARARQGPSPRESAGDPHDRHDVAETGEAPAPDPVVGDDRIGVSAAELAVGLVTPVHVYALFESVMAARAGRNAAQQRAALGPLMSRFTDVAATHPYAWFADRRSPVELATVTPDNRLVAEPYPKRMCAFLHVNQGAAALVTSLATARHAGLADRAVFCWSGADAAEVWFPSARPDLGSSAGLRAAAVAATAAAELGIDEIDVFDLYSCFPCAVEMALEALGLAPDDDRGLTVTGGLPYFGGPGNNYSLHAVATMVDRLRHGGGTGLVTALGWYLTKHAAGVYGSDPPPRGWRRADTAAAQAAIDATAVEIAADPTGPAVVLASTVVSGRQGEVTAAPVIARLPDGRHAAVAAHEDELPGLATRNLVGARIDVGGTPLCYRIPG